MNRQSARIPLALRLAAKMLPRDAREEVLGDLVESWRARLVARGRWSAWLWTLRQPLTSFHARIAFRSSMTRGIRPDGIGIGFSSIDVKLGVRMLGRQPILSIVAGLTLALGIPAALIPTHVFDVMDSDLPVDEGDRVLGLRNWNVQLGDPAPRALHDFAVWRETLTSFEALGAARSIPWNVHSTDGRAAEVQGAEVTASVFTILRVPPLLGRALLSSDEIEGAPDVVVISTDLWESRFARDSLIVGRTIGIGRRPHTVVGVMPAGFYFPVRDFLWVPLRANPNDYVVGAGPELIVLGRLADGVSVAEASAEIQTVGARLRRQWPETHEALRPEVLSYSLMLLGEITEGGATGLEVILVQLLSFGLLAVACGNVGTLILARTAMRLNEISVRTALGASRVRILSQLFAESLVLALGATAVGLVLGQTFVNVAVAAVGTADLAYFPYWLNFDLTPRFVVIAFSLGAACAVMAGVLPAIKVTSPRIQQNLQAHSRGATVRFGPLTTTLIVTEVALSMGFLCFCTGAFLSIGTERSDDVGISLDQYLVAELRTPAVEPADPSAETDEREFRRRAAANNEALRDRLAADPAVRHVAMGTQVPGIDHSARSIAFGDGNTWPGGWINSGRVHVDYFRDLDIQVLRGRGFIAGDVAGEPDAHRAAVVINEDFVDEVFGGGDAVGQRIRYATPAGVEPAPWFEIVGVVETFGPNFEGFERRATMYHPLGSADIQPMRYVIEVGGDAREFVPRLRMIAAGVDPDAIVQSPRSAAELVARQRLVARAGVLSVFALAAVGMLLAAMALYALMSFTVAQRTREIGVRTALGASAKDVVLTIARRALLQLVLGVALGSVLAWALIRETLDVPNLPILIISVAAAVVVVAALACLAPTLRGLRIQPTEALREA